MSELKVNRATVIEWLDANEIEVTHTQLAGLFSSAIEAAQAQPYDQQAMELCHVCGWKGVIDYPDGPVCVACEHDKQLAPQPTAQALHVAATSCPHEIDKDKIVLHFDSKQPEKNALAQLAARLQAAAPQPTAQALDSVRVFWQQHTHADALSMTMAELHTDVELVIRAARGAAQAAPVDAAVQQDAERLDFMIESCTQVATISPSGRKYLCYPDGRMQAGSYPTARAAIDAAAQEGGAA